LWQAACKHGINSTLIPVSVEATKNAYLLEELDFWIWPFFQLFYNNILSLFFPKYCSYLKMILYAENRNYNLCLCLSCSSRWEVLSFPWVTEAVLHQNPEKNPVLAKTFSQEEGLPTQQLCCRQLDHSKDHLHGSVSQKKMYVPTHKVVSAICSFRAENKISENNIVQMREENALNYCMTSFLKRKYTYGAKLSPTS